jgi:hypothetical protein
MGERQQRELAQAFDATPDILPFIKYTELIRRRAEKLAKLHPEVADSLYGYVEKQEHESEIMETTVTSAVWLLQRH